MKKGFSLDTEQGQHQLKTLAIGLESPTSILKAIPLASNDIPTEAWERRHKPTVKWVASSWTLLREGKIEASCYNAESGG